MVNTTRLQQLLDLHQAGDAAARDLLLQHSLDRFRRLARKMFPRSSDLRRLDETDDVLQKALLRLHRALAHVHPPDVRAYVGLAARQIRWVLRDLARERALPHSPGHEHPVAAEPTDLLEWADFHAKIEALPDEEREAFDLLLYQGLTQPEAADLLGISLSTLKRRWQNARLHLHEALRGAWPQLEE